MKTYENIDSARNPRRVEELALVNAQVAERLHRRGIDISPHEDSDELADLLSAVERFEGLVEARGGDLMVDDSAEPDDPHFVLPAPARGESIRDYIQRIDAASDQVRRHPSID